VIVGRRVSGQDGVREEAHRLRESVRRLRHDLALHLGPINAEELLISVGSRMEMKPNLVSATAERLIEGGAGFDVCRNDVKRSANVSRFEYVSDPGGSALAKAYIGDSRLGRFAIGEEIKEQFFGHRVTQPNEIDERAS